MLTNTKRKSNFISFTRFHNLALKSNNCLIKLHDYPVGFWVFLSLPLVPLHLKDKNSFNLVLQSLKLISFFSFQQASVNLYTSKEILWRRAKGLILKSISNKNTGISSIFLIVQTLLPYLRCSRGLKQFKILSTEEGNFSFSFSDISLFLNKLDEKFINWDKSFTFNVDFIWKNKFYSSKLIKFIFFKFKFLKACWSRIIWSSLGLKCMRGHGGWNSSFFVKKNFFKKFHLLWKI